MISCWIVPACSKRGMSTGSTRPPSAPSTPVRHEAERRAQTGDAVVAGRDPDRAGRVGAERAGGEVGRGRDPGAAARAACDPARVPRVARRAEGLAVRAGAERELVRVEL